MNSGAESVLLAPESCQVNFGQPQLDKDNFYMQDSPRCTELKVNMLFQGALEGQKGGK